MQNRAPERRSGETSIRSTGWALQLPPPVGQMDREAKWANVCGMEQSERVHEMHEMCEVTARFGTGCLCASGPGMESKIS